MILTRDSKEITVIYKQDGSEVEEVKDAAGRLIYSASREITGTLPLYFSSRGKPLTDYLISGDTVQDGTPTPEAPVDAVGCGVRTGNLLSSTLTRYEFAINSSESSIVEFPGAYMYILPTNAAEYFTLKVYNPGVTVGVIRLGLYDKPVPQEETIEYFEEAVNTENPEITIHNANNSTYLIIQIGSAYARQYGITGVMLNTGSTALPYEPYGYKLPLTVNGTECPIYLGQVPTTRRIKKLVLTGDENWQVQKNLWRNDTALFALSQSKEQIGKMTNRPSVNSHFISIEAGVNPQGQDYACSGYHPFDVFSNFYYIRLHFTTIGITSETTESDAITAFKSWLADKYASGTPVTVWYVLAEPETGIVNEPLHKIGDYADTISMAQAGVTIPTVSSANVLNTTSTVKPSEVYIKGKGIKSTGYGQLVDKNAYDILDKNDNTILIHGQ